MCQRLKINKLTIKISNTDNIEETNIEITEKNLLLTTKTKESVDLLI